MPGALPDRVVIFHDYSQALGGASYLVQVLIKQLRQRGLPVTFVTGDDGTSFDRDDVEIIALGERPLLERSKVSAFTKGAYLPSARKATSRWVARNDTPKTVYHVHGWCKILTPSIFAALRPVRARLILHGHDYFNGCPNGAFFNYARTSDCPLTPLSTPCLASQCDKTGYTQKLWRSGREALRRRMLEGGPNANRLLMIHPGQQGNFERAGWPAQKLKPVPNPVSPPLAERVRAEDNERVIFIGRISAEKGADLAAAAAKKAGVPITLVGDGAEMDAVRQVNPDAVLLGRQDRAGVARALSQARLSVMPSRWSEPFGLVALEAIGSGVPAIVSERALVGEGIAQRGFGRAIDTSDVDAFAALLAQLSADNETVRAMSEAGHADYGALCNSEESWTDAIIGHYRAVLQ